MGLVSYGAVIEYGKKGNERTSLFTLLSSARTWSNPDIGARKIIASTR